MSRNMLACAILDVLKFSLTEEREQVVHEWVMSFDVTQYLRTDLGLLAEELEHYKVDWLKPTDDDSGDWVLNVDRMKNSKDPIGEAVSDPPTWLCGQIRVCPFFRPPSPQSEQSIVVDFRLRREDALLQNRGGRFEELNEPLRAFFSDHLSPERVGFLMMRFEKSRLHNEIVATLSSLASALDLKVVRADDKHYSDDLLANVRTYMHGCGFGVAVFERLTSNEFNPNVSLEVGYMLALGKPVCLLRDSTLVSLQTDLVGRLYESFDVQSPLDSIGEPFEKWLRDKGLISP